MLSVLLLVGIGRRSRAAWIVFVAVGLVAFALGLWAAPGPAALWPRSLIAVQLGALLHPQIRAYVGAGGTRLAPEEPAVEVDSSAV